MPVYTIGRAHDKPLPIDNSHVSVSADHATISVDGDTWTLTDLDSKNGTYVEENGIFRRIHKIAIKPGTWIRLGEQGHRGYYFKARRVISPTDYREDFEELYDVYQEFEEVKGKVEENRRVAKFVTPVLLLVFLGLSYIIPGIKNDPNLLRLFIVAPGLFTPFITDLLLNKLEKRLKWLQKEMICPKCRRALGRDDIINRSHAFCHAQ